MLVMVLYIKTTKCLFGVFCFYKWKGNTAKIKFQECCALIFFSLQEPGFSPSQLTEIHKVRWKYLLKIIKINLFRDLWSFYAYLANSIHSDTDSGKHINICFILCTCFSYTNLQISLRFLIFMNLNFSV